MNIPTRVTPALALVVVLTFSGATTAYAQAPSANEAAPATIGVGTAFKASLDRAFTNQTLTKVEWQQQYDRAIDRKNSGKRKLLFGVLGEGIGLVLIYAGIGSCDYFESDCGGSSAMTALGAIGALGGAGLSVWGWVEYADARGDMESLERRQPGGGLPNAAGTGFKVSLGARSTVAYRVAW